MRDRFALVALSLSLAALAAYAWGRSRVTPDASALPGATPFGLSRLDLGGLVSDALASLEAGATEAAYSVGDTVANIASPSWEPPARAAPYLAAIDAAERANGIPHNLLARLLYQESRFREDIITGRKRSPVGAVGIAQFMPATAAEMGVDPLDPFQSIDGAARYLRRLYNATGAWDRALASYNWGIGNVTRKGLAVAPAETRNYVAGILGDVPVA